MYATKLEFLQLKKLVIALKKEIEELKKAKDNEQPVDKPKAGRPKLKE